MTNKFVLCRGPRLSGRFGPVKLKPLPLIVASVMVSVSRSGLLTTTDSVLLVPICTVPKFKLEELTAIWLYEATDQNSNPESRKKQPADFHRETRELIVASLSPCLTRHGGGMIEKSSLLASANPTHPMACKVRPFHSSRCPGWRTGHKRSVHVRPRFMLGSIREC